MAQIDRDAEIRDRAYHLWEEAGRPFGREHEFWAKAIREIEGDDAKKPPNTDCSRGRPR